MITWPILTLSIVLILASVALALFVLLHKGRGGGLSDLFGGGMSTSMGGKSVAERNLDRLTIIVGLIWLVCIVGLLSLYRFFPTVGDLDPAPTPSVSASASDGAVEPETPVDEPTPDASNPEEPGADEPGTDTPSEEAPDPEESGADESNPDGADQAPESGE
jgi:preprotein translocase subunit SecG